MSHRLALIIFTVIFVCQGHAENKTLYFLVVGDLPLQGYLDDVKWDKFNEKLSTFWISNNPKRDISSLNVEEVDRYETVTGFDAKFNILMSNLPEDFDEKFPNLIAYEVYSCFVKSLSARNFRGLTKLEGLYLQQNLIESIDAGIFDDLIELRWIYLSNNKISFIAENAFSKLEKLEELYLSFNALKSLAFTLTTLIELHTFSMHDNQLTILTENYFESNPKLKFVWFNNNKIHFITPTLFDGMDELRYADLRNNTCVDDYFFRGKFVAMRNMLKNDC